MELFILPRTQVFSVYAFEDVSALLGSGSSTIVCDTVGLMVLVVIKD